MVRFKEESYILKIGMGIFANEMRKHFTKS